MSRKEAISDKIDRDRLINGRENRGVTRHHGMMMMIVMTDKSLGRMERGLLNRGSCQKCPSLG